MKEGLKKIAQFLLNPRLVICVAIAWMITNGWSYVLFALGTFFHIQWMTVVAGAYLAFLWIPFTPEKIFTFAIAMAVLRRWYEKAKNAVRRKREEHREKKQ